MPNTTDWAGTSKPSTNWGNVAVNSTGWFNGLPLPDESLLLETGDILLLETGDQLLLETRYDTDI